MRYLVTGGCGFIGSHLARHLLAQGHEVTIIDDLSGGKAENSPGGANLIIGDMTKPGILDALVAEADGCFHMAALLGTPQEKEKQHFHKVNFGGLAAIFDAIAISKRAIPVVFASSAAVYGDNPHLPLKETAHCNPLTDYGVDKLLCEHHAKRAAEHHHIPSIGLRFFNVYGPQQNALSPYSGVISTFMHQMSRMLPVTIFGNGEQQRDFIYVSDVVMGITAAMEKLETKSIIHSIFNLCTGTGTSVNNLAQAISDMIKSHPQISHVASRRGDIRMSRGDPALSQEMLGLRTPLSLMQGLEKMIMDDR